LEVSKVIGLSPAQRLWKIVLPAAMPRIFVALRLAAGFALVVAVTVEIAANPQGLGYMLMIAQQTLRPELMLASLFWIGFIGWAVN
ncbi:ABC transporter permease, partial [Salmonella enterica]|uniref:ABC transporter permease n=1 Tax=Salmonella enterica TaxID=28901 RepID=UPI003CF00988